MCKWVNNLSFLRQTLRKFVLLEIFTWSSVRSCSKILQNRLKHRHVPPIAPEKGKESSLGQRVKTMVTDWRPPNGEEKSLWGRVLVELSRFLHQEEHSLRPTSNAFYQKQHSLVRMKFHFPKENRISITIIIFMTNYWFYTRASSIMWVHLEPSYFECEGLKCIPTSTLLGYITLENTLDQ